jgi:cytoskeletal protein CcmA (bactofilin family)
MKNSKIFVYLFAFLLLAGFAFASDDTFTLKDEYAGNLYLNAGDVNINSNLYGDLYTISKKVSVDAPVSQDVNVVTGFFELKDTIGGDLRLVSSSALIDGTIFGETMILGNYVIITESSSIGGPVNIRADTVIVNGNLKGNLNVKANKVVINGIVEGDAVITSSAFELGPDARIRGDLSSTRSIDETSSQVEGVVTKLKGRDDPSTFTSITLTRIGLFLMLFLIGVAIIGFNRKSAEKVSKAMYSKFLLSMLLGFVTLVVLPLVALLLLVTVVGIPIAVMIVALYIILVLTSLGFVSIFLGRLNTKIVKKKNSLWLELLIGALALALVSIIPVIFWLVIVFIGFVSIGAVILVFLKKDKLK